MEQDQKVQQLYGAKLKTFTATYSFITKQKADQWQLQTVITLQIAITFTNLI